MLDFSLRRFVQRWTRSMGIVVAKTATIHSEIEAVAVSRFLDLYKIELVLDIGANAGQYASMLRDRVNYRGQIVFCEPISHHVNKMRRDGASDNNWVIEHCAVSFNEEVSTFSIMKGDEMSSLASPTTAETGLFAQINEVFEKVDVRCTTVDALLAVHAVGAREGTVYLKIDTQGWEKNVLAGVSDFGAIACVQMELSFKRIYDEAWRYDEAIARMEELGFELAALIPNNGGHFPFLIEMDGIFRNTKLPLEPSLKENLGATII